MRGVWLWSLYSLFIKHLYSWYDDDWSIDRSIACCCDVQKNKDNFAGRELSISPLVSVFAKKKTRKNVNTWSSSVLYIHYFFALLLLKSEIPKEATQVRKCKNENTSFPPPLPQVSYCWRDLPRHQNISNSSREESRIMSHTYSSINMSYVIFTVLWGDSKTKHKSLLHHDMSNQKSPSFLILIK